MKKRARPERAWYGWAFKRKIDNSLGLTVEGTPDIQWRRPTTGANKHWKIIRVKITEVER